MKVSMITLAAGLALSSTGSMAQSQGKSLDQMAVSSSTRSAMNYMHRRHPRYHHHRRSSDRSNGHGINSSGWSSDRFNGHGINDLGVTTNQGRKNNSG